MDCQWHFPTDLRWPFRVDVRSCDIWCVILRPCTITITTTTTTTTTTTSITATTIIDWTPAAQPEQEERDEQSRQHDARQDVGLVVVVIAALVTSFSMSC